MIHEYALDPDLIATKYQANSRFFREAFGPNSIRFLSCFPHRWRQEVAAAIRRSPHDGDEMAKKAILAFADSMLEKAITRRRGTLVAGSWLNKAEHEHQTVPFHAILSESNPNRNEDVIDWDNVPEHPKWDAPRACHPRRTAENLASAVEPLLMRSREIIFVDPYFDIAISEFSPVFAEYFKCLGRSIVTTRPKVTLITGLKKVLVRGIREPSAQNVRDFVEDCNRLLPEMLPQGCECTVAVLEEKPRGKQLHNRFILTKNVAIKYGIGLGCSTNNAQSCDDLDVTVYQNGQSPWEQYNLQRQPAEFENVIEPFIVVANARPSRLADQAQDALK